MEPLSSPLFLWKTLRLDYYTDAGEDNVDSAWRSLAVTLWLYSEKIDKFIILYRYSS